MTFLYPIGLLGLIGIPIFIIVYLIKNRYTEQTIASTYMWRLSERFIKRRNPFSKFTGIISLILQLLLVFVLSFAIAHPIITLPGTAREYCFILDCSASMNMQTNGKSRFDYAKKEIENIIEKSSDGSLFTLIVVDETSEIIFEKADDKEKTITRVRNVECSDSISDYSGAIRTAQSYFSENPALVTYLVTDADYSSSENINVINVAKKEVNVSLEDVSYFINNGELTVSGTIVSYGESRSVDVNVYLDGSESNSGALKMYVQKDVRNPFSIVVECDEFSSVKVKAVTDDSYTRDNEAVLYNKDKKNSYKALLVSDTPLFLKSVIEAVSNAEIATMTTEEYIYQAELLVKQGKKVSGYGLYIFDAVNPISMPEDGSVWLIGVNSNISDSGFTVQGDVVFEDGAEKLSLTNGTSSTVRKLVQGMFKDDVYISKYIKCSLHSDFVTIYSYLANPIVFTGVNAYGNREVVFSFNLHDSDFILSIDYPILVRNLLDYSFPELIEGTEYYCGDIAQLNVVSGCESIRVVSPTGEVIYTDTSSTVSELELSEVGEYQITFNVAGSAREISIYSSVPMEERNVSASFDSIAITGEPSDEGTDGKLDTMVALLIMAALIFSAEWMVYCYDKYQLR